MVHPDSADLLALIESTDDLIWSVDADYQLVTFNRSFEVYFAQNYHIQVVAGMSPQELLPQELAALWPPLYERALREGTYHVELARQDGQCLDITLNQIITNGKPSGISIFGRERGMRRTPVLQGLTTSCTASEELLDEIFEKNGSVMLLVEPMSEVILTANQAACGFYGYQKELLIGMSLEQMECPISDEADTADWNPCVNRRHRLSGGEERDIALYSSPVQVDGKTMNLCIIHDITERNHAERAVKSNEVRYRTVFQTSLDAVLISRLEDGKIIDVNQAFLTDTGYEREEVIGHSTLELNGWIDPRDRQHFVQILHQYAVLRDLEIQFRKKNGTPFWGLISATVIGLDGVPCIVSVIRDITESKVAENEIRHLAFYDSLTGLPNRRLLFDRLQQSMVATIGSSRKHALLLVDLDNFKTLNDTLGHQMGDYLLQEVARRLAVSVPEEGTLARLGGDEFVVLLEGLSEKSEDAATHAKLVAERILTAIGEPYRLAGRESHSSASIGITVFGGDRDATQEVLQQADIAMHLAKSSGSNTLRFFAPSLQAAVNARAALEQDLRKAIKDNQFQLYYQPQIKGDCLIGAEALIRWQHPRRGLLAPAEFISLAEETELILPIGNWVLEAACRQIAAWAVSNETGSITLSVNISALQLRQQNFVETVLRVLELTGAKPENLKLELTESMLLDNIENVIQKMTELKAHGIGFSLDDFGTGYSSLAYLKRLPLAQLKIDRSFVRDILVDVSSCAIAQAVISLSHAMGLSVIAEGVETEEQRTFLAQLGCHFYQGFLYSQPLQLKDFESLLSTAVYAQ